MMREPERENRSDLRPRAGERFLDKLEMTIARQLCNSLYPCFMGDLKSKKLIIVKGFLFLFAGVVAAATLLGETFPRATRCC